MQRSTHPLFEKTYRLCQEWHMRQFTVREKLRDIRTESFEFIEAIVQRKTKEEIGLEYGDVLFTIIRHAHGEKISFFRRTIFSILPQKKWLEKKLILFQERYDWWMKHHQIHCIRNYNNFEKRKKVIDRHNGLIPKDTWIK